MGFPTRVQLIQRKDSEQWYINFPSALAQAMEFQKGEEVQWLVSDKAHLLPVIVSMAPPGNSSFSNLNGRLPRAVLLTPVSCLLSTVP